MRRAAGRRDQVLGLELPLGRRDHRGPARGRDHHKRVNTPVDVVSIATATSVAVGYWHACALLNGGAVKCWGANDHGQLGDGTKTTSNVPVDVVGIETATSISLGISNSGCTLPDGSIKTWGNAHLGDGTSNISNVPVDVPGIINAISSGKARTRASCCPATTRSSVGAGTIPDGSGTGPPRRASRPSACGALRAIPLPSMTEDLAAGRRASPRARRGTRCPGGARATPSAF